MAEFASRQGLQTLRNVVVADLFVDAGRSWFSSDEQRAILGSYGVSFRWPLVPGLVLRLDWGRRWSDDNFRGYGLTREQRGRSFVSFFFGYNY